MASSRRRNVWIAILVTLAAGVVGGAGWWLYTGASTSERDLARKEGIPTTYAEFPPRPPVPPAANAAPEYMAAIAAYAGVKSLPYAESQDQDKLAKLDHENFVANRVAVALFLKGAAKPQCDFGLPIQSNFDPPVRIGSDIRHLLRLVTAEAVAEARTGRPLEGLKLASRLGNVGVHQLDRSDVVGVLDAEAFGQNVRGVVRRILEQHGREAGVAEAATRTLDAIPQLHPNFERAVEVSNLWAIEMLSSPAVAEAGLSSGSGLDKFRIALHVPGMVARWRRRVWRNVRQEVAAIRADGGDWLKLDRDLRRVHESSCDGLDGMAVEYFGFDDSGLVDVSSHAVSTQRVLLQTAAVFREWRKTGKLPTALPLGGDAAIDPRTGGPFHYEVKGDTFEIRGAGPHGDPAAVRRFDAVRFNYPRLPN